MLKVFRDNLKYLSWVLWLVIAVFILFVFVDFGGTMPGAAAPTGAAVTVGGDKITYEEFRRAYDQTEALYEQQLGDQFSRELARQINLHGQVLNTLVANRLMVAEAERMGLQITDEELREQILAAMGGQYQGKDEYERILRQNGYTLESFEDGLRRDLLAQKVRDVLSANLHVPEADVEKSYREQVERAKVRFVKLTSASITDDMTLLPGELEEYFAGNQDDYRLPEKRTVDYLLIDRLAIQDSLEVGADEVQSYYDENLEQFTKEEQVRARHILLQVNDRRTTDEARGQLEDVRRRIEAGEDFAALAAEVSEDPGSKNNGGDLDFFGRGAMVRPFEDAAFGATPGDLLGPVQTDFGFHLIEVTDRSTGGVQPLVEVEASIRARLAGERSGTEAEAKAEELAKRIDREKLEPAAWADVAAGEIGVSFQTASEIGRDDYVQGIGAATTFNTQAFELAVDDVSDAFAVSRGWVILAVKSIAEPRLPELDEVRAKVGNELRDHKRSEAARERLQAAAADLAGGSSFEDVATGLDLDPEESGLFGRAGVVGSLGTNAEVTEAALALDQGGVGGPIGVDDGAILFEVVEREYFDALKFADEKDTTLDSLRRERLGELLDSIVAARREEVGVSYDPQLVENFGLATGGAGGP